MPRVFSRLFKLHTSEDNAFKTNIKEFDGFSNSQHQTLLSPPASSTSTRFSQIITIPRRSFSLAEDSCVKESSKIHDTEIYMNYWMRVLDDAERRMNT